MSTALATIRTNLFDTLDALPGVHAYRRRRADYAYPAAVVGWPQAMDVRPVFGDLRQVVIDVVVGVEAVDDDASDDLLSDLLDTVVAALLADATLDVQPVSDFGEDLVADGRVIIWCRLPVAVIA